MTEAFAANLKAKLDAAAADVGHGPGPGGGNRPDTSSKLRMLSPRQTPTLPGPAADDPTARRDPPRHVDTAPSGGEPLNLGNMFWKILWSRVRGWLSLGSRPR